MTRRGFTLIEAMVVIAVVALLASLVYGVIWGSTRTTTDMISIMDRQQLARRALDNIAGELRAADITTILGPGMTSSPLGWQNGCGSFTFRKMVHNRGADGIVGINPSTGVSDDTITLSAETYKIWVSDASQGTLVVEVVGTTQPRVICRGVAPPTAAGNNDGGFQATNNGETITLYLRIRTPRVNEPDAITQVSSVVRPRN